MHAILNMTQMMLEDFKAVKFNGEETCNSIISYCEYMVALLSDGTPRSPV